MEILRNMLSSIISNKEQQSSQKLRDAKFSPNEFGIRKENTSKNNINHLENDRPLTKVSLSCFSHKFILAAESLLKYIVQRLERWFFE